MVPLSGIFGISLLMLAGMTSKQNCQLLDILAIPAHQITDIVIYLLFLYISVVFTEEIGHLRMDAEDASRMSFSAYCVYFWNMDIFEYANERYYNDAL